MIEEKIKDMIAERGREICDFYSREEGYEEDLEPEKDSRENINPQFDSREIEQEQTKRNLLSKLDLIKKFDFFSELQIKVASNTNILSQCSVCRRYKTSSGEYKELSLQQERILEKLIEDKRVDDKGAALVISHSYCDSCFSKRFT